MLNLLNGTAIQIDDLCKDYGSFQLKNVNLTLPKGSIMGFIGENGAGKTTTIKLILNQVKRDKGSIKVLGLDNIEDEVKIKENIGVVLDTGFFYEMLSPVDINRVMSRIYKTWDEKLYNRYLADFSLPENKRIKDFSKGMRMKLSIALALAHNPALLILDEPTSGLDPVIRSEILDIFLDYIQDEEHSILFSSHITTDLEKIADYIAFIHDGSLIFSRTKDDLLESCGILKCGAQELERIDEDEIISYRKNAFGIEALVENRHDIQKKYGSLVVDPANLEDIMMYYIQSKKQTRGGH